MIKPILIKAGDPRVKLGEFGTPPRVDCRVIAEELYKTMYTEQECRSMLFDYAEFIIKCMEGEEESKCVGSWFEKNKKK